MMHLRTKTQVFACILIIFEVIGPIAGVPVSNQLTLVTGDENEAEPQEFPWQVSLRANLNNFHFCGGVIIDLRTVLTTASCADLTSAYMTTVVAGNVDLNTTSSVSQQIVQVTSVHIHPNYAATSDYSNDIAVLKVNPAFLFNENVAPIPSIQQEYSIPSEYAIITGWGTKREEEISLQEKLQKATVKLIHSNEECQSLIEGFNVTVEETEVCMTSPSQSNSNVVDSCTGDQGGPLIFYENDVPVLAGLISYGIGCGRPNMPSFCTRVSPYLEFIQQYQET